MNLSFKAGGNTPWSLMDDHIAINNEKIYLKDIQHMAVFIPSNFLLIGSIKLIANGNYYRLIFPYSQRKDGNVAIEYIKNNSGVTSNEIKEELENVEIKKHCSNCNKTFCYSVNDLIENSKLTKDAKTDKNVKLASELLGNPLIAIQSSIESANTEGKIKDFTRCPYCGSRNVNVIATEENIPSVSPSFSSADELKKFKDLLDSGIITQEEFDAKKKQLLGL